MSTQETKKRIVCKVCNRPGYLTDNNGRSSTTGTCQDCLYKAYQQETDEDHDILDGDEQFTCPWCEATIGAESILGTLGNRTHCRCRYCGGDFSHIGD